MADHHEPTASGLLGLHALTAVHPGAGTALGNVDLPVQRERHTGWPNIAGSALKGILRDACREQVKANHPNDELDDKGSIKRTRRDQANDDAAVTTLFGPPAGQSSDFAGAVSITDARLLAYPVRSLKGVFAWVTCPAVIERFERDVKLAKLTPPDTSQFKVKNPLTAMVSAGCPCVIDNKHLLLEEFKFDKVEGDPSPWARWVADQLLPNNNEYKATRDRLAQHLIVAHDDDFTHFVKFATEVTARIGLDYETKTVKGGALFYQEFLPTESLFYSVVIVNQARTRNAPQPAQVLLKSFSDMVAKVPVLQIGGDETTGKGYCAVRLNTEGK